MDGADQGRTRRHLSVQAWHELLQRFDGAGMTVESFCRAEGVCRSSFNRWRARLRTADGNAVPVAKQAPARQEAPPAFVDLGLLGGAGAAKLPALDLRIELGGGVVLHLVRR